MKIVLNNRIRLSGAPEHLKNMIVDKLRVVNPKWIEAQSSGRSVYGISQYILNFIVLPNDDFLLPRGIRKWILDTSDNFGLKYEIVDERTKLDNVVLDSSKIKYRPYQFDAVLKLISTEPEGILVSPAGSGKTIMGMSLISLLNQPTFWLTHTGPLAEQAVERAQQIFPDIGNIGFIGRGKWEKGNALTIGMFQTLIRNTEKLALMKNDFGMIIVDEAHHVPAKTFSEVICQLNPFYLYGLTATPYRRDKLEALMFQSLGESKTVVPLEKVKDHGGVIMPSVRYRTVSSKRIEGNNLQRILKDHIINNSSRNRLIVSDVLFEATRGHFCIVLSDRREHCEELAKLISIGWEKTGIATGKYSKKYVSEQVERFNAGEITVLVATSSLLGEGFDAPFLDRAFITMPFRAEAKCEQIIGRIQRAYPNKKDAIVYDYVDVDIGILKNQFHSKRNDCRYRTYLRLGVNIEPY